jgi:hypothetical protein
VAVKCLWIHVAVADGGQRLHAEKEGIEKRAACHPGNAVSADAVERGEDKVNRGISAENESGEPRPV